MGRKDILFLRLPDFGRSSRREAAKEQSWSSGNPRPCNSGGTKFAGMSGTMVDLSAKQSVDASRRSVLLEQYPIWELDRANRNL
jgi:hypothetical protein